MHGLASHLRGPTGIALALLAACVPEPPPSHEAPHGATLAAQPPAWHAVNLHAPGPEDIAFEAVTGYLYTPEDPTHVPGPGARTLVVDPATRAVHLALPDGSSSLLMTEPATSPGWAPNGAYATALAWFSDPPHDNLRLVELTTGTVTTPAIDAVATQLKWSPNSEFLAVAGVDLDKRRTTLDIVTVADGSVVRVATFADAEPAFFTWRLDSTWLAVSHPAGHDLWLMHRDGRPPSRLTDTPDLIESRPRWIDNDSLLFDATTDGHTTPVVVDVKPTGN